MIRRSMKSINRPILFSSLPEIERRVEIIAAKDETDGILAGFTTIITVGSNPSNSQANTTRERGRGFAPGQKNPFVDAFQREAFTR